MTPMSWTKGTHQGVHHSARRWYAASATPDAAAVVSGSRSDRPPSRKVAVASKGRLYERQPAVWNKLFWRPRGFWNEPGRSRLSGVR